MHTGLPEGPKEMAGQARKSRVRIGPCGSGKLRFPDCRLSAHPTKSPVVSFHHSLGLVCLLAVPIALVWTLSRLVMFSFWVSVTLSTGPHAAGAR